MEYLFIKYYLILLNDTPRRLKPEASLIQKNQLIKKVKCARMIKSQKSIVFRSMKKVKKTLVKYNEICK